jgi:hypothetical protein
MDSCIDIPKHNGVIPHATLKALLGGSAADKIGGYSSARMSSILRIAK